VISVDKNVSALCVSHKKKRDTMLENTIHKLAETSAAKNAVQTGKTLTAVEFMVVGFFASLFSDKRDAFTVDILCWLRVGKEVKPFIMMVYGEKNIEHALKLELFKVYASKLVVEAKGIVYKAELLADSVFTEVTRPTWPILRPTAEERMQQVFNSYPSVPLNFVDKYLSMMEKDKNMNDKKFVDRSDVKVVECPILRIQYDNKYVATLIVGEVPRTFSASISRMMLMNSQSGEGSKVMLLCTLENKGYGTVMDVCNILPIVRMPLIEPKPKELKISAV
jgi:hypothetical protein